MAIGVRMVAELERQLDWLAQKQGKTRSVYSREAIHQYLLRHGDSEEARRQSEHLEHPNWGEQVPNWSDWTA